MKNNILLIAVFTIIFFGLSEKIFACSCVKNDSPCFEAGEAKAVFVGKVIGSKEQRKQQEYDYEKGEPTGATTTYDVGEIYFEVTEAFNGVKKSARVTIYSGTGGGDCGYWFKRGETYLIYAYGESNKLSTNICTRTRPISEAGEDLPILRNLARDKTGAKISGVIQEEAGLGDYSAKTKPISDVELTLQPILGKGQIYKAKTDFEGKYEIIGVQAGKYKINLPLPNNASFTRHSRLEVVTTGFGCVLQLATIENKNEISGKIVDEIGKPVKDAYIRLISSDSDFSVRPVSDIPHDSVDLDENGNFSFVNVPAGSYFLVVNYVYYSDDKTSVYPTTFYPNGKTHLQATPIVVGRAEKVKGIVFQLPSKIKQREIRGTVFWSDGKPAKSVYVTLLDINSGDSGQFRSTDDSGEFNVFKGYEGRIYRLLASKSIESENGYVHAKTESPIFTLDENTQLFKLILDKPKELIDESERVEGNEKPN